MRDFGEYAPDLGPGFSRRCCEEPLLHHQRCLREQHPQQRLRDIRALTYFFGQNAVLFSLSNQSRKAIERQTRPRISGNVAYHIAIAAPDKNVGDRLGELKTIGNGQQMLLTLALSHVEEVDIL